jgi:branched-chain amino acid transport system ATP-binding protein
MMTMLEARDLSVYYGEYCAVKSASFSVAPGELIAFIGANGAGKTSTLRAILGLAERTTGQLTFDGQEITGLPSHERVRLGMAIVPEGRKIFPDLTVLQNLLVGAFPVSDPERVDRRLAWVMSQFPILAERRKQLGKHMSGGEQQMLAIARALMSEPKLLLIDEVSMGLMPIAVDRVFELIQQLNSEGTTILLVEQNARKALAVAQRGYVLESGRITLQDTAERLAHNPRIVQAYLGG